MTITTTTTKAYFYSYEYLQQQWNGKAAEIAANKTYNFWNIQQILGTLFEPLSRDFLSLNRAQFGMAMALGNKMLKKMTSLRED